MSFQVESSNTQKGKMSGVSKKPEQRDSAASTQAPVSSRPSAAAPLLEEVKVIAPDSCPEDVTAPENTSISARPSFSASLSNLMPHNQSAVGEPADVPTGSMSDELAGLTSAEAERRLQQYGGNEIPEKNTPWYVLLGKQFWGVMPFMLEVAAIVSAVIPDWTDLVIILAMLVLNALIGFHEEHKAKQSLDALKAQMTATVPTKRDGEMVIKPVAELVPGDIVFLRGGNVVPADCHWLEGDEMQVDTAALTGEPIPRKVPRPDRPDEEPGKGRELLSGCIIKQGEGHCEVKKTGLETEIGQAAGLVQEASGHQAGVFETKIMQVVKAVILLALIDAGILLYVQVKVRGDEQGFKQSLLAVLAIVIGAVPIALPLVMQVTMAIGAGQMAKRKAIVTHLTALQEIASMTVLCSDKTGTLTTANMRVLPSSIWTKGCTQDDALTWAGVASNPANKEDPIDNSVLSSIQEHFGEDQAAKILAEYHKTKFVGFNPTVKRTVVYGEHKDIGKFKIAKGLTSKILETGEDGGDCWKCMNADTIRDEIEGTDCQFSQQGYKTLGVSISEEGGPMKFAAIVPMLDPPRVDTMLTIYRIRQAGIGVKMITGDHLNIAIETSKLIGLGTAVLPAAQLWPASATRDEVIVKADGFAQVLPKDKREVILVLQNRGLVVGMTGDGVNDAPALAQAQIGIAVDGATEAARSAADIILTTPGLSAIFEAVVESRKIFARLRAYVLYRMAATIQIVLVLSFMIYGYDDVMKPLYVILLALFNDISMLPIANDNASPSSLPEIPSMPQILLASCMYGGILTAQTMGMYEFSNNSGYLRGDDSVCANTEECKKYIDCATYLQISIAIEFVIFSCRTPGFCLLPKYVSREGRPSLALFLSVMCANVLISVLAGLGWIVYQVRWLDILYIWIYDIVCLVLTDLVKVLLQVANIPWMSAGAGDTVLGYPELPCPDGAAPNSLRSGLSASRASQRSLMRSHVQSQAPLSRSLAVGPSGPRPFEPAGPSMLPFPYNMRANVQRNCRSF